MTNTSREMIRKLLLNTINSCKTVTDLKAIDTTCTLFHCKDSLDNCLMDSIAKHCVPVYGATGVLVYYEVNKRNVVDGVGNRIDEVV